MDRDTSYLIIIAGLSLMWYYQSIDDEYWRLEQKMGSFGLVVVGVAALLL